MTEVKESVSKVRCLNDKDLTRTSVLLLYLLLPASPLIK